MSRFSPKTPVLPVLMATVIVVTSSVAFAAFEWRGSLTPPAPPVKIKNITPPALPTNNSAQSITWNEKNAIVPAMPAVQSESIEALTVETSSFNVVDENVLAGFGSNLPLVIALHQVIPHGYQVSFASGVSAGDPVSWQGGKPWEQVLSDMLMPHKLSWRLNGRGIIVGYFDKEKTPIIAPVPLSAQKTTSTPMMSEPVQLRRQKPSSLWNREATQKPVSLSQLPTENIAVQKPTTVDMPAREHEPIDAKNIVQPTPVKKPMASEVFNTSAPISLTKKPAQTQGQTSTQTMMPPVTEIDVAPVNQVHVAQAEQPSLVTPALEWTAVTGQTLREVLTKWSNNAGVELYWSIDYDYRLRENMAISGNFPEAVGKLFREFARVRPQPYGQLHGAKGESQVLVVKSYDLSR